MRKIYSKEEIETILKNDNGAYLRVNHIDGWSCYLFVSGSNGMEGEITRDTFNQLNLKCVSNINRSQLNGIMSGFLGMSINLSNEDYKLR